MSRGGGGGSGVATLSHGFDNLIKEYDASRDLMIGGVRTATEAAVDLEDCEQSVQIEELELTLKKLIQLEHEQNIQKELLKEMKRQIEHQYLANIHNNTATNNTTENIHIQFNERLAEKQLELSDSEITSNQHYRDFRSKIWQVKHSGEPMPEEEENNDEDEELVVSTQKESYKCPITMKDLSSPVYSSKKCKHRYSDAILGYLQGSKPCPVSGCRTQLTRADVERDKTFERTLERKLRQAKSQQSQDFEDLASD